MLYNRYINAFIKTAQAKSFAKASEALFITPTALIKQINLFEHEMGVKLFVRSPRGISLTQEGLYLYNECLKYVRLGDEIEQKVHELNQREKQILKIGTSPMTSGPLLIKLFTKVQKKLPKLKAQLIPFMNEPEIASEILYHLGEKIDIVAGVYDNKFLSKYNIEAFKLEDAPLILAVPLNHPLSLKENLNLDELNGFEILLINEGWMESFNKAREILNKTCPQAKIHDFPFFSTGAFNRAFNENLALILIAPWLEAHPQLISVKLNWPLSAQFGILHAKTPSTSVISFLDAIKNI